MSGMPRPIHPGERRPLTPTEWQALLTDHGFVVERADTAPMALLLTQLRAHRLVLAMRRTFRTHRDHLAAVGIVATKPG